jgi:opacity protein-like surface antigen
MEIAMKKMTLIMFVLAVAGCAGAQAKRQQDAVVGHWTGVIDRDGWQRPLSVDIASDGNAYGGSWMSLESQPGVMIDRVEVQGDAVRFDLKALSFDGRVNGRTLSGSVTDRSAGTASGQFQLTRIDPRPVLVP